jgi:hypothetical protein
MKLDPGIHIVKHLVFFGKSGVTSEQEWPSVERERVVSKGEDIDKQ